MKHCQNCGKEMREEDKFCSNCGAAFQAMPEEETSQPDDTHQVLAEETPQADAVNQEVTQEPSQTDDPIQVTELESAENVEHIQVSALEPQTADATNQTAAPVISDDVTAQASSVAIETKFNWGAFVSPVTFGIAHRSYLGLLGLLVLVPYIGWLFYIAWCFVFGFYGEKWTLDNAKNQYRDNEEFRKVMSTWNRSGFVGFIIAMSALVLLIILFIIILMIGVSFSNHNMY